MIRPDPHPEEAARLQALARSDLVATPAEERFDRIVRMALRALDVPMAVVSLVAEDEQWFKASHGMPSQGTPRDISFCGHAILGEGAFVVPDAARDDRFHDNPLVVDAPRIRFYAGIPLQFDGLPVGVLCVMDHEPREFGEESLATLRDLATMVEDQLRLSSLSLSQQRLVRDLDEVTRRSRLDDLTRCWNRTALMEVLARQVSQDEPVGLLMVDIDGFKQVNDTHGHVAGDAVIAEVASRLRGAVRPQDAVGRYGGEEFLVALENAGHAIARPVAERVRAAVGGTPFEVAGRKLDVTVSVGLYVELEPSPGRLPAMIQLADQALYAAKRGGRNRVVEGVGRSSLLAEVPHADTPLRRALARRLTP